MIPSSSECFKYILYADDTTLFSTIQISEAIPKDLNKHLAEVYNWLAVNKLSLNVKKTKYIVFHVVNKNIEGRLPELKTNDISIERVQNFNFLGLNLNEYMSWKNHIDIVANVCRINNIPALIHIMTWRRPGDKPLSEPMMVDLLTYKCVTRSLWFKMAIL